MMTWSDASTTRNVSVRSVAQLRATSAHVSNAMVSPKILIMSDGHAQSRCHTSRVVTVVVSRGSGAGPALPLMHGRLSVTSRHTRLTIPSPSTFRKITTWRADRWGTRIALHPAPELTKGGTHREEDRWN